MSNIVVHKTSELDLSTNFTNSFLDGLLEQYCKDKYVDNTIIADGIPKITLDTLIKFAYPGYYCKSPGLYGQISSTHVIVVYEDKLHNVLQEALDHKLSRLFVAYQSDSIPLIEFEYRSQSRSFHSLYDMGSERHRDFSRSYMQFYNLSALEDYCAKAFRGMRMDDLELDHMKTPMNLVTRSSEAFVIYKPNVEAIQNINKTAIDKNVRIMASSFFFSNTRDTVVNSYWLAIHINMSSSLSRTIRSAVGQEYYAELVKRADVILKQQQPVMHGYITGLRSTKEERERIEREAYRLREAKAHKPPPINQHSDYYKDPNTTENLKDIDIPSTSFSDNESTPEDGSFAVVIIAAVVAFFLFLLFR